MGYNKNCDDQDCIDNCCNYYGSCPSDYQGWAASEFIDCEYYYEDVLEVSDIQMIYGIVFGVVGLLIIICIIVKCYKSKQAYKEAVEQSRNLQQQANKNQNTTLQTEANLTANNYNQPYYNNMNAQPAQFNNGYNANMGYNQPMNYGNPQFNQVDQALFNQVPSYGQPNAYQINYNQGPIVGY